MKRQRGALSRAYWAVIGVAVCCCILVTFGLVARQHELKLDTAFAKSKFIATGQFLRTGVHDDVEVNAAGQHSRASTVEDRLATQPGEDRPLVVEVEAVDAATQLFASADIESATASRRFLKFAPLAGSSGAADGRALAAGTTDIRRTNCGFESEAHAASVKLSCSLYVTTHPTLGERQQCCCAAIDAVLDAAAVEEAVAAWGATNGQPATLQRTRPLGQGTVQPRIFTCLPSLIIAGAQKSGTTALFGLLLHHPCVLAAVRKEVHYFDKALQHGPQWYLQHLPPYPLPAAAFTDAGGGAGVPQWQQLLSQLVATTLTAEATPSYMLRPDAGAHIARTLPDPRVVVLLRDPVDRTYSEWQMKLRRVAQQVNVSNATAMAPLLQDTRHCLLDAWQPLLHALWPEQHWSPTSVHTDRMELVRAAAEVVDSLQDDAAAASTGEEAAQLLAYRVGRYWQQAGAAQAHDCLRSNVFSNEVLKPLTRLGVRAVEAVRSCLVKGHAHADGVFAEAVAAEAGAAGAAAGAAAGQAQGGDGLLRLFTTELQRQGLSWLPRLLPAVTGQLLSRAVVAAAAAGAGAGAGAAGAGAGAEGLLRPSDEALHRTIHACFLLPEAVGSPPEFKYESIGDIAATLRGEMESVRACSRSLPDAHDLPSALGLSEPVTRPAVVLSQQQERTTALTAALEVHEAGEAHGNGGVEDEHEDEDEDEDAEAGGGGGLAVLDDGVTGCWPDGSSSNIAKDFVYRSIYTRQVSRLVSQLGADRVLVVSDEALRQSPQRVLDALCDFVRLPRLNVSGISEEEVAGVFALHYPSFMRTGWRMEGAYEPLNTELQQELRHFFRPHTAALEAYLGVRFGWR